MAIINCPYLLTPLNKNTPKTKQTVKYKINYKYYPPNNFRFISNIFIPDLRCTCVLISQTTNTYCKKVKKYNAYKSHIFYSPEKSI